MRISLIEIGLTLIISRAICGQNTDYNIFSYPPEDVLNSNKKYSPNNFESDIFITIGLRLALQACGANIQILNCVIYFLWNICDDSQRFCMFLYRFAGIRFMLKQNCVDKQYFCYLFETFVQVIIPLVYCPLSKC